MTDHTELRDRIRRAVYERLAHGPSAPDVLDPIADAAMSVIAPVLDEARARLAEERNRLRGELMQERKACSDLYGRVFAALGLSITDPWSGLVDAAGKVRAENERLRAEIQQLCIEPAGYMHAVTGETYEPEDLVAITPDGPAAIADTTCHGASSCRSPVHFDSCLSETPGERIPDHRDAPREWTPGERVRVRGHRDRTGTVAHLDTPGRVRVAWDTHPDTPMSVPADRIEPAEETRMRSWHVGDPEPIEEGLRLMGRDSRYASDEWKPDEYWYRNSSGVWSGPWGYKLSWDALLEHQAPLVEYRKPTEETR